jgi:hypothetical protein
VVVLWLTIDPDTDAGRERLSAALGTIRDVDADLQVSRDAAGLLRIGGVSELHLGRVVDRLRREFGVEGPVGRPQVARKETVTRAAVGEAMTNALGLEAEVETLTWRRGTCTTTFSHFAPSRPDVDGDDRGAGVTTPLHPRSPLRDLRASVPEPAPDDDPTAESPKPRRREPTA